MPLTVWSVAVMVTEPAATPEAFPVASILAIAAFDDDHVTLEETSDVVPSEYAAEALYFSVMPETTVPDAGLTVTDLTVFVGVGVVGAFTVLEQPERTKAHTSGTPA